MSAITRSVETSQNYDVANDSIIMSSKDLELAQKAIDVAKEKLAKAQIEFAQLNEKLSSAEGFPFNSIRLIYAIALLIFIAIGLVVIDDDLSLAFTATIGQLFNSVSGSYNSN